jgi:glycosyltransferase involved in cell wall biosynthesis
MIKIAFLTRDLDCGGSQRQVVTLANALAQRNIDITVLCFYAGGLLEKELDSTRVNVISLEKRGRWNLFSFFYRLAGQLRSIQPDVLHGYLSTPNILTILLKPLLPSTQIVWGVRASYVDLGRYNWLLGLLFQWECFLSRFADLIIVNSKAGRVYHLTQGFPDAQMVVIPNGIDTEYFKPNPDDKTRVRAEWEVSEDTVLIGLLGRLDPMKDHPTFLRAAAILCQKKDNVRFVCVGGGLESYSRQLHQLAQELGISQKVIWAGVRRDMPAVYNALDITASSSAYGEGFSNAIGEAMACGVPCVVTDVGDSAWIVGDTGIVVPPQNPEALAAGWLSCLERNRGEMGLQARDRIIHNFSLETLVHKTTETLLSVLKRD